MALLSIVLALGVLAAAQCAQIPDRSDISNDIATLEDEPWETMAPQDSISIACRPDMMHITITLAQVEEELYNKHSYFNGIVYPAGLGTNSSCLKEYRNARGDLQYSLPLRSCNTMANDKDDGTMEFFNNIIVQPHLKLVTGRGRGYRVSCAYRRRDLSLYHHHQPRADRLTNGQHQDTNGLEFDEDIGSLPFCSMKIYKGDPDDKQVASNVHIGDTLTLVVSLEKNKQFGLLVSECNVRDGLGWGEQSLIVNDGCSLNGEIMGMFQYSEDKQTAQVSFPAHKFPYTASVYYTCEVKLCDLRHPTDCEPCTRKLRTRRQADEGSPATVEVYSGLYVDDADSPDGEDVTSVKNEDEICISQRNFAIAICIAGVILMACVIAAIAFILARRRGKTYSRTGSSLYSGPYTNTGYSHTS